MALESHIEMADTGSRLQRERAARQIARRARISAKGTFRDDALLPATFQAVTLSEDEIGRTFRTLFWKFGADTDQRIRLLSALLGE